MERSFIMEFMEIIKCPSCGKMEKIKFKKQYCSSCGCYLPLLLKEKKEIYQHPYSYFPLQTTYFMGQKISSNNLETSNLSDRSINIYSQTQANLTQLNSYLNTQMQSAIQTLDSRLRQYEAQINQSIQSQYIINSLNNYHYSSERDVNGRLKR